MQGIVYEHCINNSIAYINTLEISSNKININVHLHVIYD